MILCCGEALIDMLPNQDSSAFVPHVGGAILNTAVGLGRQGMPVGMMSGVSNDLFGQRIMDVLQASQVDVGHLIRSDLNTTLAFVELSDGKASYSFYDENTAGRMVEPSQISEHLSADIEALFFGGISLAVEPCGSTLATFLDQHGGSRIVMMDPNIRPAFIENEQTYRDRLSQMLGQSDVVKISDEDLDWINPNDWPLEQKAAEIITNGPTLVCVTLGSKGAELYSASGLIASAKSEAKSVVDTVGAGDAFNAGFLTQLSRERLLSKQAIKSAAPESLARALSFAVAFASDTVTRAGSDPAWNFDV